MRLTWTLIRRTPIGALPLLLCAACAGPVEDAPPSTRPVAVATAPLLQSVAALAAEATVYEDATGNNGGSYSDFCVGNLTSTAATRRAFVRYDMPSVPSGASVTRVVLTMIQEQVRMRGAGPLAATLEIGRVTSAWTEGVGGGSNASCGGGADVAGIDWAGAPTVAATDSGSEPMTATNDTTITFDTDVGSDDDALIADVQGWLDGGDNHGFRLVVSEEATADNARRMAPGTLTIHYTVPNGQTCSVDSDCTSGNCVATDGSDCGGAGGCVCCNAAICSGGCESCHLPGVEGSCDVRPSTGSCRAASCSAGTATAAAMCDGGSRSCPVPVETSCSPYACDGTACGSTCSNESDCAAGFFCNDSSACEAERANGTGCDDDVQCTSGSCTDGVCCAGACDGQCEACNVSGSEGSCLAVTGAPVGTRPACTDDSSGCGGTCNGTLRATCSYPGSETRCRAASCSADTAIEAASCAGAGTCPAVVMEDCGAAGCDGVVCASDRGGDGDGDSGDGDSGDGDGDSGDGDSGDGEIDAGLDDAGTDGAGDGDGDGDDDPVADPDEPDPAEPMEDDGPAASGAADGGPGASADGGSDASGDSDDGCSCAAVGAPRTQVPWPLLLAAPLLLRLRRRLR